MAVRLRGFIDRLILVWLLVTLAGCAGKAPVAPTKTQAEPESSKATAAGLRQVTVKPEVQAAFNQAVRQLRAGQYKQAIKGFEKVSKMAPRLAAPAINIAIAWRRLGDTGKANKAIQTALKKDPNSPEALNVQGILLRESGKLKAARKSYEKALSIYPDYAEAHLNLAMLCDIYLVDWQCAKTHYGRFQELQGGKDKQVAGWVADLDRRMKKAGKRK